LVTEDNKPPTFGGRKGEEGTSGAEREKNEKERDSNTKRGIQRSSRQILGKTLTRKKLPEKTKKRKAGKTKLGKWSLPSVR